MKTAPETPKYLASNLTCDIVAREGWWEWRRRGIRADQGEGGAA
jgi:hypothetical protein